MKIRAILPATVSFPRNSSRSLKDLPRWAGALGDSRGRSMLRSYNGVARSRAGGEEAPPTVRGARGALQFAGTWRTGVDFEPGAGSGTGFGISADAKRGTIWSAMDMA